MDTYAGLDTEAKELVREHRKLFDRLPLTFRANTLVDIRKWSALFEPERKYFRVLFDQLSGLDEPEFEQIFGELARFEARNGFDRTQAADAMAAQEELLSRLRSKGVYSEWRGLIDTISGKLDTRVEASVYSPSDLGPRLVVLIYGQGIAIERDAVWRRFRDFSLRFPLSLGAAQTTEPFLSELFTGFPAEAGGKASATLFNALSESKGHSPLDAWIIEAGDSLHALCERSQGQAGAVPPATGLSYDRLRAYRERLSDAIVRKIAASDFRGPVELERWLETLNATPQEGFSLYAGPLVLAFARDILVLGGNGSLIINNSFVEWSSVQALHRAQPRVLVARFGVRDKLKPFSSLLLFSKPRPTDVIPILQDPLGSFVDVELLSYYIWLKSAAMLPYRGQTLYLLVAEGVDEAAGIPPSGAAGGVKTLPSGPVTLSDLAATMAEWLGARLPGSPGRPISALLA